MKKNFAKKFLSLSLALMMLLAMIPALSVESDAIAYSGSSSYMSGRFYTALKAVVKTGNQRTDIVNVAKSQVGYQEGNYGQLSGTVRGSSNYTEYGRWYGMQDMWCAMFVSWCAKVAGVSTSVVPSHAYTPTGLSWFQSRGQAYSRSKVASGSYTPQGGDIIYFKSSRNSASTNHIGIVTGYSGSTVYTVEGNTSSATVSTNGGAVAAKSYSIYNTYIVYICKPSYSGTSIATQPTSGGGTTTVTTNANAAAMAFDADFYARNYKDLSAAFGTNTTSLKNHWLAYGIKEGRTASAIFDVKYYLANNADLKAAFGTNYTAAYNHFLTNGYKENRNTSLIYNAAYYKAKNADLSSMSYEALLQHFYTYGMKEGRTASATFNFDIYKANYADLRTSYGTDNIAYYKHFLLHGRAEGRNATSSTTVTTPTTPTTPTVTTYKGTTTTELNMRESASTTATILKVVPANVTLTYTEVTGTWAKVTYGGKTGWVSTKYLSGTATPTVTTYTKKATTTLNMRSLASTSGTVLAIVPSGTSFTYTETSGTWAKVTYGGKTGWVSTKYLA